jgi:hypothetical protein
MIHGHSLTKEAHVLTSAMCLIPPFVSSTLYRLNAKFTLLPVFYTFVHFLTLMWLWSKKESQFSPFFCYFNPYQDIARARAS